MNWQTMAGPKHSYSTVTRKGDGRLALFALAEDGSIEHCSQSSPGDSTTWSDWQSLGKGGWREPGPGSFAVGVSADCCLEVFVVADSTGTSPSTGMGPDILSNGSGQIFHNRQIAPGAPAGAGEASNASEAGDGCEWSGWHTLDARYTDGWSTILGATVVRDAEGLLNLFVMSANRGVLEENWWSDYTNSTGIGHFRQLPDGRWNGPELRAFIETCIEVEGRPDYSCKSKLPVKLIAALNSDRRLELFANAGGLEAKRRGVPGITNIPAYLWHARQTRDQGKNWGSDDFLMPPAAIGDTNTDYDGPATQPSVVLNHEGNLEVYVWGNTDHHIWVRKQDPRIEGRWLPWRTIGETREWKRSIVVSDQNKLLTVLASSMTSNSIWYLSQVVDGEGRAAWPGEWHPVTVDGDEREPDILHAITNEDGRVELFASGPDGVGFSHTYQLAAGQWS